MFEVFPQFDNLTLLLNTYISPEKPCMALEAVSRHFFPPILDKLSVIL